MLGKGVDIITKIYTISKILAAVTETPRTTKEIIEKLSYVDENGKKCEPASSNITTKLRSLCEAGLIKKIDDGTALNG